MNIQLAVIEGANILKDKYIQTAQLDAEILMAKVLGANRKYIILNNDKNLKGKKMRRNEPCYCGSGKKFKHCCGAL